jgi:hypothetical protein
MEAEELIGSHIKTSFVYYLIDFIHTIVASLGLIRAKVSEGEMVVIFCYTFTKKGA